MTSNGTENGDDEGCKNGGSGGGGGGVGEAREVTAFSKQRIALDVILSNGESNASSLVSNSVPEQTTLVSSRSNFILFSLLYLIG